MVKNGHTVQVAKKAAFLRQLVELLAGGARLSLEGDLSRCRFDEALIISREAAEEVRRNTLIPQQDFVILRLEPETIDAIFKQVLAAGFRAIVHVQIERNGVLELGAYDHFHKDCVVTGQGVTPAFLAQLREQRVVRGFDPAAVGGRT